MEWIFVWLAFPILAAIAANARGHSAGLGFLLGLLFGPFALIGYLVAGKKETSASPPAPSGAGAPQAVNIEDLTKKCPQCAERIKLEALVCRFCGQKFSAEEVKAQIEEVRAETDRPASPKLVPMAGNTMAQHVEAFCLGCRTVGPMELMLKKQGEDEFYHKECAEKLGLL